MSRGISNVVSLVRHSLRRYRVFMAAAYLALAALQLYLLLAARALEQSGKFKLMASLIPDFLARFTNMTIASFRGFALFEYSHPVVLLFLVAVAIAIGTEPAAEVELKFVDLMMSRPVGRGAVIVRSVTVLVAATAGALGSMLLATWGGMRLLTPVGTRPPEPRVVVSLAANLGLEVVAWGAIALAAGAFVKRRATAAGACALLAIASFILDYVGRFWDAAKGVSRVSPFHYFSPFDMIAGRALRLTDVIVLAGITAAASVLAGAFYIRRDL